MSATGDAALVVLAASLAVSAVPYSSITARTVSKEGRSFARVLTGTQLTGTHTFVGCCTRKGALLFLRNAGGDLHLVVRPRVTATDVGTRRGQLGQPRRWAL
jgi:hypothetical protein